METAQIDGDSTDLDGTSHIDGDDTDSWRHSTLLETVWTDGYVVCKVVETVHADGDSLQTSGDSSG